MNKPTKWALKIIGGIFAVLIVILLIIMVAGGSVIKGAVNTVGSPILGVPVHLNDAYFNPLKGKVSLNGLTIGNPEGFSEGNIFSLDEVSVHLDIASLPGSDPIIIHEIVVDNIGVLYELKGGKSNLETLLAGLGSDKKKEEKKEEKKEKKPSRDVIIESMIFKGGTISGQITVLSAPLHLNLPLPAITMHDLGKSGPTTIETVIEAVVKALNEQVIPLVEHAIAGGVKAVGEAAKAVGETAGDAVKAVEEAAGDAAKAVGDAAGDAVKAIGGLFGGHDDEKK